MSPGVGALGLASLGVPCGAFVASLLLVICGLLFGLFGLYVGLMFILICSLADVALA